MADSNTPSGSPFSSASTGPWEGRRSLNDPVLTSAEEELDVDTPTHDTGTSYTGTDDSSMGYQSAASKPEWWMRMEDQVGRYVSEKPGKAALMALGAGALAALLLGQRMRGRRRRD